MTEVSLDLARQYMLDRVDELLNHDVKVGTPFVFLNALTLLTVMNSFKNVLIASRNSFLPEVYKDLNLDLAHWDLTDYFSLGKSKLNLSHVNEDHLKVENEKTTLAAEPFLRDIREGIVNFFDSLTDPVEKARVFVQVNDHKFVGYGE